MTQKKSGRTINICEGEVIGKLTQIRNDDDDVDDNGGDQVNLVSGTVRGVVVQARNIRGGISL